MKVKWLNNKEIRKETLQFAKSKSSTVEGYLDRELNTIFLNTTIKGNPIKCIFIILHELVHYFLRNDTLDSWFDYICYGWRIKDGKWIY